MALALILVLLLAGHFVPRDPRSRAERLLGRDITHCPNGHATLRVEKTDAYQNTRYNRPRMLLINEFTPAFFARCETCNLEYLPEDDFWSGEVKNPDQFPHSPSWVIEEMPERSKARTRYAVSCTTAANLYEQAILTIEPSSGVDEEFLLAQVQSKFDRRVLERRETQPSDQGHWRILAFSQTHWFSIRTLRDRDGNLIVICETGGRSLRSSGGYMAQKDRLEFLRENRPDYPTYFKTFQGRMCKARLDLTLILDFLF